MTMPPFGFLYNYNQIFNAKLIAVRISPSFSPDNVVINGPMFDFETVCMWSQLTAQSLCMPSRRDKSTSLGMSRIVEVVLLIQYTLNCIFKEFPLIEGGGIMLILGRFMLMRLLLF